MSDLSPFEKEFMGKFDGRGMVFHISRSPPSMSIYVNKPTDLLFETTELGYLMFSTYL